MQKYIFFFIALTKKGFIQRFFNHVAWVGGSFSFLRHLRDQNCHDDFRIHFAALAVLRSHLMVILAMNVASLFGEKIYEKKTAFNDPGTENTS